MLKLVTNEWVKYFSRPATYLMMGLIVLLFLLITVISSFTEPAVDMKRTYSDNWQQQVKSDIKEMNDKLGKLQSEESEEFDVDKMVTMSVYQQEIPRLEYYLKQDVKPPAINNFYEGVLSTTQFSALIAIMVVVIAGSLMSKEFQQGTIKLLLIRPASRLKIYMSKWLLAVIASLVFVIFTYLTSAVFTLFTAKMNPGSKLAIYDIANDKFHMVEFWPYLLKIMFGDFLFVLTIASIAYVLSVITRNTAAAQGISLGLLFFGGLITSYIASKTDLVKYIWPANWSLNQYLPAGSNLPVDDMTYAFSFGYDVIALIIILAFGAWLFNRRDVAN